jgi:hypothetical protein
MCFLCVGNGRKGDLSVGTGADTEVCTIETENFGALFGPSQ